MTLTPLKTLQRSGRLSHQRGVALIATLVFLFILTVIVVLFLGDVEDRVRYRAQTAGNEDMRRIARDYLTHTLGVLEEFEQFDSDFVSALQGWGDPLLYEPFPIPYEGLRAVVVVEDLATQLPLSLLDESTFALLLESLGIDGFTAMRLRDVYFDWIDADDETRVRGAEAREYENDRTRLLLTPANRSLQDISEFQYMMGFRDWLDPESRAYQPELFERFTSMLTVAHGERPNLNVAGPDLLRFYELLHDLNPLGLERYLAGQDRVRGTMDDRWVDLSEHGIPPVLNAALGSNPENALYATSTNLLRIRIELERFESYRYRLEVWVQQGGATPPTLPASDPEQPDSADTEDETRTEVTAPRSSDSGGSRFEVLVIRENM